MLAEILKSFRIRLTKQTKTLQFKKILIRIFFYFSKNFLDAELGFGACSAMQNLVFMLLNDHLVAGIWVRI